MLRVIISVLFFTTLGVTMATEHRGNVFYQLNFKVNGMMCVVKINGMPIVNTMDIKKGIPFDITRSDPVTELIDQGENTLSLEGTNLGEYIKDPELKGYCEATLVASMKNPDTQAVETKTISQIRYEYEKDNMDNPEFTYIMSTKNSLDLDSSLTSDEITTVSLPSIYDDAQKAVQEVSSSREFYVNHHQPFSWIHESTPFEDTPENRLLLWEKYAQIRAAILAKSKRQFRKLVEPGLTDSAAFKRRSKDQQFEAIYSQIVESFTKLNPATWRPEMIPMEEFDLEIYAGGKLFRFNEKKRSMASPLQWYNPYTGEYDRYNPTFTFINGKIVMAFF